MTDGKTSWSQALSWRMTRQFLGGTRASSAVDVIERLTAVAVVTGDPELAVAIRRESPEMGEVASGLASGHFLTTYAFGGATYVMTPEIAGVYLALRSASRQWELPSWQSFYDLAPADWPALREVVRAALADGALTRPELAAVVTATPRFRHLGPAITSGSDTLIKPFAWQGDLCLGPARDGHGTLRSLVDVPGWNGIPDLDVAGHRAILMYLDAYGPASPDRLQYWLGEGLSAGKKRIIRWLAELGDRLVELDVDDGTALCLAEHVDELLASPPAPAVRLLPGFDQWVRGPGTADVRTVPPDRRTVATRGASLVLAAGRVAGTWKLSKRTLAISWFPEAGPIPSDELAAESDRIAQILDRPLSIDIEPA